MSGYANEDRERRETSSMEKSELMTIEFLRARLLAERSVSKAARQRADELANRVAELEEQLKLVSLQREKAEKATTDILVILKNHGIVDVSEEFDSSAEPEENSEDFKDHNSSPTMAENSTNVKLRNNEKEAYSSSEVESSPSTGRSLSWRSTRDSQNLFEKKKCIDPVRRRASFSSNGLSSRRGGKSCRRIKHRDSRSVDELQNDSIEKKMTHSKGSSNCSDGKEEDMESALLHQAELIGQYEEEEKAQREWEDKFRENNSGTQDSCDPGNYSDVTEERYEAKSPQLSSAAVALNSNNQEPKQEPDVARASEEPLSSKASPSPADAEKGSLQDEKRSTNTLVPDSSASDFSFPKSLKSLEENAIEHIPLETSPYAGKATPLFGASSSVELAVVPQETSNGLGSVLEALQRAKLSLNQKLGSSPRVAEGTSNTEANKMEAFQTPIGTPGLFRLPTDRLDPSVAARSSLANAAREFAPKGFFTTDLSRDTFLSVPSRSSTPEIMRSQVPPEISHSQPRLGGGRSTSYLDAYSNPVLQDSYPFLPDIKLQIPSKEEGVSRNFPSSEKGLPPVMRLSSYNGQAGPNMYR